MSTVYIDNLLHDGMVPDGPPRWRMPLLSHGIQEPLVVEQDAIFGPLAAFPPDVATGSTNDPAWPDDPDYKLVQVGEPEPIGGGYRRATLIYAKVPGPYYLFESPYSYRFPGIIQWVLYWRKFCDKRSPDINDPNAPGDPPDENSEDYCEWRLVLEPFIYREPRQLSVESRIHCEYMLQQDPPTPIQEQRWRRPAGTLLVSPFGMVFLGAGAWADIYDEYLHTGALANPSTNPTVAEYAQWVANGQEFVAETSVVERWLGNIWVRKTRYVKAR